MPEDVDTWVVVCSGQRCRALLPPDGLAKLREVVRCSRRTVLVSTDCLQACVVAPLVVLTTLVHTKTIGPPSSATPLLPAQSPRAAPAYPPAVNAVRSVAPMRLPSPVQIRHILGPVGPSEVRSLVIWLAADGDVVRPLPAVLAAVRRGTALRTQAPTDGPPGN